MYRVWEEPRCLLDFNSEFGRGERSKFADSEGWYTAGLIGTFLSFRRIKGVFMDIATTYRIVILIHSNYSPYFLTIEKYALDRYEEFRIIT